jgi:transposase
MLDTKTGGLVKITLTHEGNNVREFYSKLPRPVRVGIEATGSMPWFLKLMEELGIECLVGHPAEVRAAEARTQKHDRRDANLILKLLVENRFPAIWLPSEELQDLRSLLRHRHQWVSAVLMLAERNCVSTASAATASGHLQTVPQFLRGHEDLAFAKRCSER